MLCAGHEGEIIFLVADHRDRPMPEQQERRSAEGSYGEAEALRKRKGTRTLLPLDGNGFLAQCIPGRGDGAVGRQDGTKLIGF